MRQCRLRHDGLLMPLFYTAARALKTSAMPYDAAPYALFADVAAAFIADDAIIAHFVMRAVRRGGRRRLPPQRCGCDHPLYGAADAQTREEAAAMRRMRCEDSR